MEEISSKPYFIRAVHEWCTDNGYTPHIAVVVQQDVRVPQAYVREGQIVLNISTLATHNLMLANDHISFQARFNGVTEHVFIPISAVRVIYAPETSVGLSFEAEQDETVTSMLDAQQPPSTALRSVEPVEPEGLSPSQPQAPEPSPPEGSPPPRRPTISVVK